MSKRVQVLLTDEQYKAIHGRCKNDSESVKELMMLGMEYEKNVSRKQKIISGDIDLENNKDLYFLICFAEAKRIQISEFFTQLKQMFLYGDLDVKKGKIIIDQGKCS